jgi:RHS repeat-associated protein
MAWEVRYYHYDALGSTCELTASNQTLVERHRFDAYGNARLPGLSPSVFLFIGQLGYYAGTLPDVYYYLRRRHYDPRIATFPTWDPVANLQEGSQYRYALSNPLLYVDPSGLLQAVYSGGLRPAEVNGVGGREIIPTRDHANSLGAYFTWVWEEGDGEVIAQRVSNWGSFTMRDTCGQQYSIGWSEKYVEAWVKGVVGKIDYHRMRPARPARCLAELGGFIFSREEAKNRKPLVILTPGGEECAEIEEWSFYMEATFEAQSGSYKRWRKGPGFYTGKNEFSVTGAHAGPCNYAVKPCKSFDHAIYPGAKGDPPLPGFPPDNATSKVLRDHETWYIHWQKGWQFPKFHHTTTKYKPVE